MLQLPDNPADAMGSGGTRLCFMHPENADLCIKVHRDRSDPERYSFTRRLRTLMAESIPWMNTSCQEIRLWQSHLSNPIHPLHAYFPEFYGMVATNLGLGQVVECVRDYNGEISKSLAEWFEDACEAERKEIVRQLRFLAEQTIELELPIFDWNPQNLLVQCQVETLQIKMVDFEGTAGNGELIRVSNWVPLLRRRKVGRRVQRGIVAWLRSAGYCADDESWSLGR